MENVASYAEYMVAVNCCPKDESEELIVLGRRIAYLSFKNDPDGDFDDQIDNLEDVNSPEKVVEGIKSIYEFD